MIKFKLQHPTRGILLGIGLTEANIQRMKADQPAIIRLEEMGLRKGEIVILYGVDEADLLKQLKPHMGKETQIIGTPPDEPEHLPQRSGPNLMELIIKAAKNCPTCGGNVYAGE